MWNQRLAPIIMYSREAQAPGVVRSAATACLMASPTGSAARGVTRSGMQKEQASGLPLPLRSTPSKWGFLANGRR